MLFMSLSISTDDYYIHLRRLVDVLILSLIKERKRRVQSFLFSQSRVFYLHTHTQETLISSCKDDRNEEEKKVNTVREC